MPELGNIPRRGLDTIEFTCVTGNCAKLSAALEMAENKEANRRRQIALSWRLLAISLTRSDTVIFRFPDISFTPSQKARLTLVLWPATVSERMMISWSALGRYSKPRNQLASRR